MYWKKEIRHLFQMCISFLYSKELAFQHKDLAQRSLREFLPVLPSTPALLICSCRITKVLLQNRSTRPQFVFPANLSFRWIVNYIHTFLLYVHCWLEPWHTRPCLDLWFCFCFSKEPLEKLDTVLRGRFSLKDRALALVFQNRQRPPQQFLIDPFKGSPRNIFTRVEFV